MNTENELCISEIPTWALETAPGGKNVIVDFNILKHFLISGLPSMYRDPVIPWQ